MKRRFAVLLALVALSFDITPAGATELEKEPVIPGITLDRKTGGGFLGIEIVDGNFKLSFYGKDKQPVAVDFPRALLRWEVTYKNAAERLILSAAPGGKYLTSTRVIRPPYNFQLFITLLADDQRKESETYVLRFRQ
ncbi:MAG: hypothetical protein IT582_10900 [Opitutaceae bacterium]|nr:hypothetical protein [Opitutaceae bacterium]